MVNDTTPGGPVALHHVKPGDRIKVTIEQVGVVHRVDLAGQEIHWRTRPATTHVIERATRPKPRVGEVLSAQDVRDTWWKRGSIIATLDGSELVLQGDGLWRHLHTGSALTFKSLIGPFAVKRVA